MSPDLVEYLTLPNFELSASYCREKRRGGACIIVKKGLKFRVLEEIKKQSVKCIIECCAIELTDCGVIIACVYRVPKTDLDIFYEQLEKVLSKICNLKDKKVIICGDLNINRLENNPNSRKLEYTFASYDLKLLISKPTRLSSGTCIDNFASNIRSTETEVIEMGLSDHTAQLLICSVKKYCTLKSWQIKCRDFNNENLIKFKECMNSLTFNDVYCCQDVNVAYDNFLNSFKLFYDLCFPHKIIKKNTRNKPKWLSKGIKVCS